MDHHNSCSSGLDVVNMSEILTSISIDIFFCLSNFYCTGFLVHCAVPSVCSFALGVLSCLCLCFLLLLLCNALPLSYHLYNSFVTWSTHVESEGLRRGMRAVLWLGIDWAHKLCFPNWSHVCNLAMSRSALSSYRWATYTTNLNYRHV